MWAYESVFYQIYPLGFCGAPFENDGVLEHYIFGFVRSILSDHVQSDHKKAERNILAFQNLRI